MPLKAFIHSEFSAELPIKKKGKKISILQFLPPHWKISLIEMQHTQTPH